MQFSVVNLHQPKQKTMGQNDICNVNEAKITPMLRRILDELIKLLDEHSETSCSIAIQLSKITVDEKIEDPGNGKALPRDPRTLTEELIYAIDRFHYVNSVNTKNLGILNSLI